MIAESAGFSRGEFVKLPSKNLYERKDYVDQRKPIGLIHSHHLLSEEVTKPPAAFTTPTKL